MDSIVYVAAVQADPKFDLRSVNKTCSLIEEPVKEGISFMIWYYSIVSD